MQRVLDPAQIEAFAQRTIPRTRLPDPTDLFSRRATRLRQLAVGSSIAGYLQLMAALCDAQHEALKECGGARAGELDPLALERIEQARRHGLPLLPANGWPRHRGWRDILTGLCERIASGSDFPEPVSAVCRILADPDREETESQAEALLSGASDGIDAEAAPFIMAALQVYWVDLGHKLQLPRPPVHADGPQVVVCPLCGTLPVASVVRADGEYNGYRYLHCALCATEWHLVRIKCSHCLATDEIGYHFLEHGSDAIRAESCPGCRTYRKILYREKDPGAEAVADDLASLPLDLLMSADGFRRASGNPLLWQPST
jgi:FdhE protein